MKDSMDPIPEILGRQLGNEGYDVVDLIPIPVRGDRMVRMRTLEEVLEDLDEQGQSDTVSYLIQVRPRAATPSPESVSNSSDDIFKVMVEETYALARGTPPVAESVYLPNGKLNAAYLLQNADLLMEAREFNLARNIYKTILDSGEKSGLALFGIARTHEEENRPDEARKAYEESITYHPTLESYRRLTHLLVKQRKDHEAAEAYERALSLKDLAADTRLELHKSAATCWFRTDHKENAERHFRSAIDLNPAADDVQAQLGNLLLQTNQVTEAKRCFQDAIASNPRNDRAYAGLGYCAIQEGDKRSAHDHFAQALDINLQNPNAIYQLVKCAYEIRTYSVAARIVAEYIDGAPINANLLYSLAGLQFHLGRMDEARKTLNRTLEIQLNHSGAKELLKAVDKYEA